ncbi:hypothetical protein DICVIV_06887 [Dictyocaulus viviparus]|uniref:C2H2-type domain-containing protein n=1 Tax=Dictyocaulus viviparus TaxID=29172 RepID=A0A0D8XRA1_DICVI|nr:hypothetical protein DICVIV_06887 [Dictyocaulus viviparus]
MPSNSQRKHTIPNKVKKRPGKDIDQIHDDMKPKNAAKLLNQEINVELPGDGQFYCVECGRYFIDEETRIKHMRSKVVEFSLCFYGCTDFNSWSSLHKSRVRSLRSVPYTIKEAEAAAGHGFYEHITLKSKVTQDFQAHKQQRIYEQHVA